MPNWCNNSITITGDKSEINKLLTISKSDKTDFSLGNLVPIPPESSEDWYSWCVQNWGTKWDFGSVEIEIYEDSISFSGETAWAPPIPAFIAISKDFPTLKFNIFYEEPGMDFCGQAIIENGNSETQEASYSENFGTKFYMDIENSKIVDGDAVVPVSISKKYDPYDFTSAPTVANGFMKFSIDLSTPDDFEELINSNDLKFEFGSDFQSFAEDAIQSDSYSIGDTLSENWEEMKSKISYLQLNKELPKKDNITKTRKL